MIRILLLFIALLCTASAANVMAQSKFFSTPSRGGAEGAKQNAQLTTLQTENERMNACTAAGRVYAPTHANRDANDCIPHLTLNPTNGQATFTNRVNVNSGGVNVTGNSTFNNRITIGAGGLTVGAGGANITGNTTLNNNLAVTGTSTFSSNMNVNARVTANQLYVGSGNVGNIPTCTSAQKLQWSGTAWTCVTDNIGATASTEVDPKVGALTNGRWCRTNGSKVICDVNVPVSCGNAQKLKWDGSSWSCIADQGITQADGDGRYLRLTGGTLSGTLNAQRINATMVFTNDYSGDRWCRANTNGRIQCTAATPSGSTSGGTCVVCCDGICRQSCSGFTCSGGDDDFGDW
ncbi:hypothetical protein APZ00_10195 [Pannonibacter phragmitetus]|uniref:Uncharacterized protein n=1 Tax=Pannonibacter phragmitetus TaxID=121719 RepID=A0A0U3PTB3_9HYPH|nr:hypothetical protein APZ00_10195 [Pannonibacter phragmitetus]